MPADSSAAAARTRTPWLGIALLVTATLLYSTHTNLTRISYDYGVGTLTILAGRSLLALPLIALWLRWRRQPLLLPRRALPMLALTGGTFALQSLFYLQAIHHIPVSLAVLLFYLFPILVVLLAWAIGDERLTRVRALGAVLAFGGLALALDVRAGGIHWLGVGLGAAAALTLSINIIAATRMIRTAPAMTVTFNMMLVATLAYCVALAATGGPTWPSGGATGWALLLTVLTAGALAQMCFYAALAFIGGSRASIIMYGEPIGTTALALLLLGETLTPVQVMGTALVIAAIFGEALLDRPARGAGARPMP